MNISRMKRKQPNLRNISNIVNYDHKVSGNKVDLIMHNEKCQMPLETFLCFSF
jgi:hypothetical protein